MNASKKNTPSMHHPRRRNVTTSMAGFRHGHTGKNLTQNGEPTNQPVNPRDVAVNPRDVAVNPRDVAVNPRDVAGESRRRRRRPMAKAGIEPRPAALEADALTTRPTAALEADALTTRPTAALEADALTTRPTAALEVDPLTTRPTRRQGWGMEGGGGVGGGGGGGDVTWLWRKPPQKPCTSQHASVRYHYTFCNTQENKKYLTKPHLAQLAI